MNVCLFTDSLEPSGVGQHMLTLAWALAASHRLSLVCPPSPAGDRLLERARELGAVVLAQSVRSSGAEAGLCAWLREQRAEVLHVHAGIGWEGHHGVYAARKAGVPVVRTEHLPYLLTDAAQRADYARVAALTDRIVCVSAGVRDSYAAAGAPRSKMRVVRNGIVPRRAAADRAAVRRALGLAPGAKIALTVARFSEQKGHRDLLAAGPAVVDSCPDVRFAWVGDGPLEAELRERVAARGLGEAVRFLGRRPDVPELLAAADVFVLPSHFEGLPLVALEAMAAGLPVVGTRVCGTAEAIDDGVTGRLVAPGDAVALADGILELLTNPACARQWGRAGRERVTSRFSAERMARETLAVYAEVSRAPATTPRIGTRAAQTAAASDLSSHP